MHSLGCDHETIQSKSIGQRLNYSCLLVLSSYNCPIGSEIPNLLYGQRSGGHHAQCLSSSLQSHLA